MPCSCGHGTDYASCCAPIVTGKEPAATAEALMRARYSAYAHAQIDFLHDSLAPEARASFDRGAAEAWARGATWRGLEIQRTEAGGKDDATGVVEFVAHFTQNEQEVAHAEVATFRKQDGRWFFVDGVPPKAKPFQRTGRKIERNEPCPCGSGKKYKKCCGAA